MGISTRGRCRGGRRSAVSRGCLLAGTLHQKQDHTQQHEKRDQQRNHVRLCSHAFVWICSGVVDGVARIIAHAPVGCSSYLHGRPARNKNSRAARFPAVNSKAIDRIEARSPHPAVAFSRVSTCKDQGNKKGGLHEESALLLVRVRFAESYSLAASSSCSPSMRICSSSRSSASCASWTSAWTWAAASSSSGESWTLR